MTGLVVLVLKIIKQFRDNLKVVENKSLKKKRFSRQSWKNLWKLGTKFLPKTMWKIRKNIPLS